MILHENLQDVCPVTLTSSQEFGVMKHHKAVLGTCQHISVVRFFPVQLRLPHLRDVGLARTYSLHMLFFCS